MRDRGLLGQIALEHKIITEDQLRDALEEHRKSPSVPIGAVLVRKGFIDFNVLQLLLNLQEKRLDEQAQFSNLKKKDILFGRLAVEYGFATAEQLNECLREQADAAGGGFVRLGELLVKKGIATPDSVRILLDIQNKKILFCRRCRTRYNVAGYLPYHRMKCTRCGDLLTVPEDGTSVRAEGTTLVNPEGQQMEVYGEYDAVAGAVAAANATATAAAAGATGVAAGGATATAGAGGDEAKRPLPTTAGGPATGDRKGTTIKGTPFGPYELIRRVATGPKTVYKAWDRAERRFVALKVLAAEGASVTDLDTFGREADVARRLAHPGIVPLLDAGVQDGKPFLAMEYVEGATLRELLAREHVGVERAFELLKPVAEAVSHAHARGVLHRDLKPENILVDAHGDARVCDFGVSLELGRPESKAGGAAPAGTAAYMSPEQVAGDALDVRSDVYGLGACLYEAVTGRPPYLADTAAMVLEKVKLGPPPAPRAHTPDLPPDVDEMIRVAMARRREDRYASPQALADDMERYLRGLPLEGIGRSRRVAADLLRLCVLWAIIFGLGFLVWWRLTTRL
ncbi:MAG: serine/threonine protein kinase [Planctomycetes bacterium]|nr:serine/threonine protein kinase [Planctomycetota bacterium]